MEPWVIAIVLWKCVTFYCLFRLYFPAQAARPCEPEEREKPMSFAPMTELDAANQVSETPDRPEITFESFAQDIALLIATSPQNQNPMVDNACQYCRPSDHERCLFGQWLHDKGVPDLELQPQYSKAGATISRYERLGFLSFRPGHQEYVCRFANKLQARADGSDKLRENPVEPRQPRRWSELLEYFSKNYWLYQVAAKRAEGHQTVQS